MPANVIGAQNEEEIQGEFHRIDADELSKLLGTSPIILQATQSTPANARARIRIRTRNTALSVQRYPIVYDEDIESALRNNHMSYAITWYAVRFMRMCKTTSQLAVRSFESVSRFLCGFAC